MNLDANKDMTVVEDKIDQVRAHIYKNRRSYAIAGGVVGVTAIGVAGYFLGARTGPKSVEQIIRVEPKVKQLLSWKPVATIEITIEALGDPGNIIQDITTGTIYASQNQAAKALGVSKTAVYRNLKGESDLIGGTHKLVNLGKAYVPEVGKVSVK